MAVGAAVLWEAEPRLVISPVAGDAAQQTAEAAQFLVATELAARAPRVVDGGGGRRVWTAVRGVGLTVCIRVAGPRPSEALVQLGAQRIEVLQALECWIELAGR